MGKANMGAARNAAKREFVSLGFVPKQPVGVACMACDASKSRLAVCRVDGSMEMWRVDSRRRPYIHREFVTPARRNTTYRGVVWIDENRVVTVSLGGQLVVHSAADLSLLDVVSSNGGAIWAMDINPTRDTIAIACNDKRVRFFSVTEKTVELMPKHTTMVRPDSERMLSVKFSKDGTRVYFGDNTGTVTAVQWQDRKTIWDVELTTRLQNIGVSRRKEKLEVTPAMCWDLLDVENSVLAVTSTGEMKVIDPLTGVLLQSIRSHKSDLLSVVQVDDTVFATGVDNILATFKAWEGEWVKSEGRTWGMCDVTCMVPLDEGILLTGSLDGFIIACETRQMFPAKNYTGKASVLHVHQPYTQHTHAFTLAGQQMVASVEPFSVTIHRVPELKEDDREIVAELRYDVAGADGISSFVMDPQGRGFVYATAARTGVVRVSATDDGAITASPVKEWEGVPAATSLAMHGEDVCVAHAAGVTVMHHVFSVADAEEAKRATVSIRDAPLGADIAATSAAGHVALASAPAEGVGHLTILAPQGANGTAGQLSGKKRKHAEAAAWGETLAVARTMRLNSRVRDLTFCRVEGRAIAFVILVTGTIAAYDAATGEAVWNESMMPTMQGLNHAQWCEGSEHHVLLSSNEWFALLDLSLRKGYRQLSTRRLSHQCREKASVAPGTLVAIKQPLQGARLSNGGNSIHVVAAPFEKLTQLIPKCFWRKQYGT